MLKIVIAGLLIFATVSFGMSLTKLNGASKAELMEIKGIGEVKAAALIKERKKGKFKSFDGLAERVEGIGEQTAANLKNDTKSGDKEKKVTKRQDKVEGRATKRQNNKTKKPKTKKPKTKKPKTKKEKRKKKK